MGEINYKGKKIKSGDEIEIAVSSGKIIEAVAEVQDNILYLCSNYQKLYGSFPDNKHGKRYAFAVSPTSTLQILKKGEKPEKVFQITEEINEFINKVNPNYLDLFKSKNEFISSYDRMNQPKDETELSQGFVVLHSKERGKMLKIKLGRLVRKLIIEENKNREEKIEFKDTDIETLHNNWVSYLNEVSFVLSKGKEIFNGYDTKKYAKKGSLSSCMNNAFNRLDFYTRNKNVGLLICYFKGEVCGRALVWECKNGRKYHDRIYVAFDWVRKSMTDFFAKEGIQNAYGAGLDLKVSLDYVPENDSLYPYLDTFKIKNNKIKELSTY